jgi:hypothetical protein
MMATYQVTLSIVTDAETPEEALDDVRSGKWAWTVRNLDTDAEVELMA